VPGVLHRPMMATTDIALITDPVYQSISKRYHEDPALFADQYARAWFKLLHRDMGPVSRYLGPDVPEPQLWQDPVPPVDHELVGDAEVAELKQALLGSGLTGQQLVRTAWAAASSFRTTDMRGGANGARLRLSPQKDWAANDPAELAAVLPVLERVKADFERGGRRVSLADVIVLGGCAAVEQAALAAGFEVTVPFRPGRTDASQEQTDVETFAYLEPRADGFRNYLEPGSKLSPETLLVDRAYMLDLTAKEMTVLVGGLRAARRQHRRHEARRLHRPPGRVDHRLLPQPARPVHLVAHLPRDGEPLRGARRVRSGRPHGDRRGPGVRVELDPARDLRGLRLRRRACALRPRLRQGVGEGHGAGPVRPAVVAGTLAGPFRRMPGGACGVCGAAQASVPASRTSRRTSSVARSRFRP
jgi:hypothetical protein